MPRTPKVEHPYCVLAIGHDGPHVWGPKRLLPFGERCHDIRRPSRLYARARGGDQACKAVGVPEGVGR